MNIRALEYVYKYEIIPYKHQESSGKCFTQCKYISNIKVGSGACECCDHNHGDNEVEVTCDYEYESTRKNV